MINKDHHFDNDKIFKDNNFDLFEKESSFELTFFKKILPYLSFERSYRINLEGKIKIKNNNYILKLVDLYFCERKKEFLKDIFDYIVSNRKKIKFKKISRYSSLELEKVKENFFKTIFSGENINFPLRYSKEIFLRDERAFEEILLKSSLINFGYKSSYAFSLIRLIKNFPKSLDEILYVYLIPFCNEKSNLHFYNKAYFTDIKEKNLNIEAAFINKDYESLKYIIQIDFMKSLEYLLNLTLINIEKIDLKFLMQFETLIYFLKFNNENNKKIIIDFILVMFIVLNEYEGNTYLKEEKKSEKIFLKEYIFRNIQKMLG